MSRYLIRVSREGVLARLLDGLMVPVMYLAAGTLREAPQRTHRWNNRHLTPREAARVRRVLDPRRCVVVPRDPHASPRWLWGFLPRFHIPVCGGWRRYVVVAPREYIPHSRTGEWFVGWETERGTGISRIPLDGAVRLLRGPHDARAFGIDAEGRQIALHLVGKGKIGRGGPWAKVPLL